LEVEQGRKIDIVVGNINAPSTIYFNDGSGRHFSPVQFGDNKGAAYGFAIGDLDRDGWPDIHGCPLRRSECRLFQQWHEEVINSPCKYRWPCKCYGSHYVSPAFPDGVQP
jgi:hypothetical protein